MGKDENATLLGRKGGQVSTRKLTPEQITSRARKAGKRKWKNTTPAERKAIMAKVRAGRKTAHRLKKLQK